MAGESLKEEEHEICKCALREGLCEGCKVYMSCRGSRPGLSATQTASSAHSRSPAQHRLRGILKLQSSFALSACTAGLSSELRMRR